MRFDLPQKIERAMPGHGVHPPEERNEGVMVWVRDHASMTDLGPKSRPGVWLGVLAAREDIERQFGRLTNHGGGLAPLPHRVRRFHPVRIGIQAKLLAHAAYVSAVTCSSASGYII